MTQPPARPAQNKNAKSVNPATRFSSPPNENSYTLHHKNRNEKSVNPATRFPGANAPSNALHQKKQERKIGRPRNALSRHQRALLHAPPKKQERKTYQKTTPLILSLLSAPLDKGANAHPAAHSHTRGMRSFRGEGGGLGKQPPSVFVSFCAQKENPTGRAPPHTSRSYPATRRGCRP